MIHKQKILAICGSTKASSTNKRLLHAIADLNIEDFDLTILEDIAQIPHFNPDLDNETPPPTVADFRRQLSEVDGIIICTPEYAMGVPGTLKNALDWIVSSYGFGHKPTALITASTHGHKGHQALLETLRIIEADITEETQLVISFINAKVSKTDNIITDPETKEKVMELVHALKELIKNKETVNG